MTGQKMKLAHYAAKEVKRVRSCKQHDVPDHKPQGFWVSCDGYPMNWREWCTAEQWGLCRLTHVHEVKLATDANILRLRKAADIDEFTHEYGDKKRPWVHRVIHWERVAVKHQGIIIAPYIWERRHSDGSPWYYCWDCASGCIWDAAAITSIELKEQPKAEAA